MNVNATNNNEKIKPKVSEIVGGVVIGSVASGGTNIAARLLTPKIVQKMQEVNNLSADEFTKADDALSKLIKHSGLDEKGVEIIRATDDNVEKIFNVLIEDGKKGIGKFTPEEKIISGANGALAQLRNSTNAFFSPAGNKIFLPAKDLSLMAFHEAGHAINKNISKFGKALQKMRGISLLAAPIALIGMFTNNNPKDDEPKKGVSKVTSFVKDNAGVLTAATFTPMLAEEGLASLRGNKLAKELLDPSLAKKVAKSNALGFASYALVTIVASLGVHFGIKAKDAAVENMMDKRIEKQEAKNA